MSKVKAHTYESVFELSPSLERHRTCIKKLRIDARKALVASAIKRRDCSPSERQNLPLSTDINSPHCYTRRIETATEFLKQIERCHNTGKPLSILCPSDVFRLSNAPSIHGLAFEKPTIDGHDMFLLEDDPESNELKFSCSLLQETWHSVKHAFEASRTSSTFTITHQDGNTPENLARLQKLVDEQRRCARGNRVTSWPGHNLWSRNANTWINGWKFDPFEETTETNDLFLRMGSSVLDQPTIGRILFFPYNSVQIDLPAGTVTASLPLFNILPKMMSDE